MSASREKKKRQDLYEAGNLTRDAKKTKQQGMSKLTSWIVGIGAILIAVIFVCLIIFNSNTFLSKVTAFKVGDRSVSASEANYYYKDAVSSMANYFGDYFQYFVDTSKSYKSQQYSEDQTWADYFMEGGESSAQQYMILSDAAKAEGVALTADEDAQITSSLDALDSAARQAGYQNLDAYLKTLYGKACNRENYAEYLRMQALASNYRSLLNERYEFSDSEIDSYYSEHKNDFDTVDYRVMVVNSGEKLTPGEAKAEAERIADVSANHEAIFLEEVNKYYQSVAGEDADPEYDADSSTLAKDYSYSSINGAYVDWLFGEERIEGETYVADGSSSASDVATYYVVYYLGRNKQDYNLVNVRHILISVDDTTDTTAMADAKARAEEILTMWKDGEATEESFSALAAENSSDGSAADGGLISDIYKGRTVTNFNDWCFDSKRQVGDTDIVETEYGYHVMYYVGESDETYLHFAVDNTLRSNTYSQWFAEQQASYPIQEKSFGMLFVNR